MCTLDMDYKSLHISRLFCKCVDVYKLTCGGKWLGELWHPTTRGLDEIGRSQGGTAASSNSNKNGGKMDAGRRCDRFHSRPVGGALTKQTPSSFTVHQSAEARAVGGDFFDRVAYV